MEVLRSLLFIKTAQAYTLLGGVDAPTEVQEVTNLVYKVYGIVAGMAGIVAFAAILYAAALFFLANGDQTKITKARTALLYALLGAGLIIISRYAIVSFIKVFGGGVV